jgi:Protein of unknown function (DUF3631)
VQLDDHTVNWANGRIDGAELVAELIDFIRRFVVISESQAIALAFYVLHTHAFEAARATPYLHVTAPTAEAGKTRVLEVLEGLIKDPLPTANASAAAIYRSTADSRPTLLFDEIDGVFKRGKSADGDSDDLRRILNAGYTAGKPVIRCVGDGSRQTVTRFDVFSPKALFGIGALPRTLATRSLPIRMKKKTRDEQIERLNIRRYAGMATPLRERAASWAQAHIDELAVAEPAIPDALSDRQQDVAEPLLAIAEAIGRPWPRRLAAALVELLTQAVPLEDDEAMVLLADIRSVFERRNLDRLATTDLLTELREIDGAPWHTWWSKRVEDADKAAAMRLAQSLRPFGIRARKVRVGADKPVQGFDREQFEDAWKRYLPAFTPLGRNSRNNGLVEPKRPISRRNIRHRVPTFEMAQTGMAPSMFRLF